MPFGSGVDGALSSATIPTITRDYCSGNADSTTLTTSASTFATGDLILIHQTRGTGVGQWEINRVATGGSSTPTLQVALKYTYTTSGGSVAQAIKIPQYLNTTIQSGTWTLPSWDSVAGHGGIFPIAIRKVLTGTGNVVASGNNGGTSDATGSVAGGVGIGFKGGDTLTAVAGTSPQGEGTAGAGTTSTNANGNGGGGATNSGGSGAGGGGGSNVVQGTNGNGGGGAVGGTKGNSVGSADLTNINLGGGGGSGHTQNSTATERGSGGAGGGIIMIFTDDIELSGTFNLNGGNGGAAYADGGGGAGGSCLIVCRTATLGSNLITATGGVGGGDPSGAGGGTGGVGAIAVHHSGTVTGTTNPTFTDVSDPSLIESLGGSFLLNMI